MTSDRLSRFLLLVATSVGLPSHASSQFLRYPVGDAHVLSGDGRIHAGTNFFGDTIAWDHVADTVVEPRIGPNFPDPTAISFDGSVIAGRGYRWEAGFGEGLGVWRLVRDMSADGAVLVGEDESATGGAFRWTLGVSERLPAPDGWDIDECVASGISADGSVVAGHCRGAGLPSSFEAVRWEDGVPAALGPVREVHGISADGSTLVGEVVSLDGAGSEAFVWRGGAFQRLGTLPGDPTSVALATSADGSIVVGSSGHPDPTGFLWTEGDGMLPLSEVIESAGIAVGDETFPDPVAISDDGFHVLGSSTSLGRFRDWLVYLAPDRDYDFVLDADDAFPDDPTEWADRDGDGVGDHGDTFPDDPAEWSDLDHDGVGDNGDPDPSSPAVPTRAVVGPGDVLVARGTDGIVRVDPETGEQVWLAWEPGFKADGIDVAPDGTLYTHGSEGFHTSVHRIDSASGAVTLLAEGRISASSFGLDRHRRLVFLGRDEVRRIDPSTGETTVMALESSSRHLVVDGSGHVLRVEPPGLGGSFQIDEIDLDFGAVIEVASYDWEGCASSRSICIIVGGRPSYRDVTWSPDYGIVALGEGAWTALPLVEFDPLGSSEWVSVEVEMPPLPVSSGLELWDFDLAPDGTLWVLAGTWVDERKALVAVDRESRTASVVWLQDPGPLSQAADIAVVPDPAPPVEPRCSAALSTRLPRGTGAWLAKGARCLARNPGRHGSVQECLADPKGTLRKLRRSILAAQARSSRCASLPADALGARELLEVSERTTLGLLRQLFGSPFIGRARSEGDAERYACQRRVFKAASRCIRAHQRSFLRCKRREAGRGAVLTPAQFEACLGPDPGVERKCHAATRALASGACVGVPAIDAVPGLGAPFTGDEVADRAACLACRGLERVHGLAALCPACR